MNVHGLKLKSRNITRVLEAELSKKRMNQCTLKIRRLRTAKRNCNNKIRSFKVKEFDKRKERLIKSFKKGGSHA